MKIKITALDKMFSQYIRQIYNWTCQRCHKPYTPPTTSLHCSHFHGRGKKSVRFEPDNAVALCFGCHQHFHANPHEHVAFMEKRLGTQAYNRLLLLANIPKKPDYKAIKIWLKAMLKGQEEKDVVYGKH